jgi:hypothetical protein
VGLPREGSEASGGCAMALLRPRKGRSRGKRRRRGRLSVEPQDWPQSRGFSSERTDRLRAQAGHVDGFPTRGPRPTVVREWWNKSGELVWNDAEVKSDRAGDSKQSGGRVSRRRGKRPKFHHERVTYQGQGDARERNRCVGLWVRGGSVLAKRGTCNHWLCSRCLQGGTPL